VFLLTPSTQRKAVMQSNTSEAAALHAAQASSDEASGGSDFDAEAEAAGDDSDQPAEPAEDAVAEEQPDDGDGDSVDEGSVDFDPEIVEDPRTGVEVKALLPRATTVLPA